VLVLNVTISSVNDKTRFVLATVNRPPGHHSDFIKESADLLSELVLADKGLIIVDNTKNIKNRLLAVDPIFLFRPKTFGTIFLTLSGKQTQSVSSNHISLTKHKHNTI